MVACLQLIAAFVKKSVLISDWPSCSFSEAPVFFIFFGVFMKSGKMVRKPRMSTNLWQLSAPSGPIIPWSRTFRALVRDIFFSLQQREEMRLKSQMLNVGSVRNKELADKWPKKECVCSEDSCTEPFVLSKLVITQRCLYLSFQLWVVCSHF